MTPDVRSLALLIALAPGAALAQTPDSTIAPPTDSIVPLAPVVVTASRLPLAVERSGFAVRVLGARELERRAPFAAVDLFREEAGVFVDESVGPGGPTILRVRGGEEVFTQVLVDGVQINQNGGFLDLLGLALSNLGRVEIARGPQSAVHGSSAVSGVVHFTTPVGPVGAPQWRGRIEGGGASEHGGRWRGEGSVRGGSERFRYSAGGGTAFSRGVWALPNDTHSDDGSLRLDWLAGERLALGLTARRARVESKLPVRDAGVTRVPLDPNAHYSFDRSIVSASVRLAPTARTSHRWSLGWFGEDFRFADQADGVTSPPEFFVFDANLTFLAALARTTLSYQGTRTGIAGALDVVWGGQWEREALDNRIRGDFSDDLSLDRASGALFAELGWRPSPDVVVVGGARAEKYEGLGWEATPRVSAAIDLAGGRVTVRSAAGRAYKAPNLQQQYVDNPFIAANPAIRAERSASLEVGIDTRATDGSAEGSVTLFRQTFDDLIRTVAVEGTGRQTNRNLGRARAQGIEWSSRVSLAEPVRLGFDGALIDTEVLDNVGLTPEAYPVGEELPFRASLASSLFLEAGSEPLWARVRLARTGSQHVLTERFSGRRVELAPYTLVGLTASYRIASELRIYLRADNVLEEPHLTAFDRPGAPRSLLVGMELRF